MLGLDLSSFFVIVFFFSWGWVGGGGGSSVYKPVSFLTSPDTFLVFFSLTGFCARFIYVQIKIITTEQNTNEWIKGPILY